MTALTEKAKRFARLRASGLTLEDAVLEAGYHAKNKRNRTSVGWMLEQQSEVKEEIARITAGELAVHNHRGAIREAMRALVDAVDAAKADGFNVTIATGPRMGPDIITLESELTVWPLPNPEGKLIYAWVNPYDAA